MAEAAGIYKHLWRPDETDITMAAQLIGPLKDGLQKLKADPQEFRKYDALNGWGTYDEFVPWLEEYIKACEANPDAGISVDR